RGILLVLLAPESPNASPGRWHALVPLPLVGRGPGWGYPTANRSAPAKLRASSRRLALGFRSLRPGGRLGLLRRRALAGQALLQRVEQIDHVRRLGRRPGFRRLPAGLLGADQFEQRVFVFVVEFRRIELRLLLLDDVLGELDHLLVGLHRLDLVE